MSNLAIRILVALVGIPLVLLLTIAGGWYFFGFVALISGFALHEFYGLARAKGMKPQIFLGLLFGFCVNLAFLSDTLRQLLPVLFADSILQTLPQLILMECLLLIPLILLVELFRNEGSALGNISSTLAGVGYVSLGFGSLVGIRELFLPDSLSSAAYLHILGATVPQGAADQVYHWGGLTVVSVFASIWACDSGAYFAGMSFGKHKLFERVSPNKTWEGAISGFACAIGVFVLARTFLLPFMSLPVALVCGCIVGVVGQLGDMAESLLKRDAGVKDSSSVIPGHGGVLDRFDSLIFVSPLIFFYLKFVVF